MKYKLNDSATFAGRLIVSKSKVHMYTRRKSIAKQSPNSCGLKNGNPYTFSTHLPIQKSYFYMPYLNRQLESCATMIS